MTSSTDRVGREPARKTHAVAYAAPRVRRQPAQQGEPDRSRGMPRGHLGPRRGTLDGDRGPRSNARRHKPNRHSMACPIDREGVLGQPGADRGASGRCSKPKHSAQPSLRRGPPAGRRVAPRGGPRRVRMRRSRRPTWGAAHVLKSLPA